MPSTDSQDGQSASPKGGQDRRPVPLTGGPGRQWVDGDWRQGRPRLWRTQLRDRAEDRRAEDRRAAAPRSIAMLAKTRAHLVGYGAGTNGGLDRGMAVLCAVMVELSGDVVAPAEALNRGSASIWSARAAARAAALRRRCRQSDEAREATSP